VALLLQGTGKLTTHKQIVRSILKLVIRMKAVKGFQAGKITQDK
jgi:hypothetical protein